MSTGDIERKKIIEPNFLLNAYASGYFPMADSKNGEIGWYSPDPRGIFPLEAFNITRSLRQAIRNKENEIRIDSSFERVMRECGTRKETWISEEIIASYVLLYELGYAHSVELWRNNELAGGLYGVTLGGAFFGESMFSKKRDASKIALAFLVELLNHNGFELLDTQWITPHLSRLGAIEITREEYLVKLKKAIRKFCNFSY